MSLKSSVFGVAAAAAALALGLVVTNLFRTKTQTRGAGEQAGASSPTPHWVARDDAAFERELTARLRELCESANGDAAVAVTHVESGRTVSVNGATPMPLFSVFKLPLAVTVLKEVEQGRLRLEHRLRIEPSEAAPGTRANTELWSKPVEMTVAELIELSIARSDNTSSDKLMELVGSPEVVTRRMRLLGLQNIEVRASVREFAGKREHPNTGTAEDLARLLAMLQTGEALAPRQFAVLRGSMERAVTGLKRLRGDLPAGTLVADKTGTGENTTNDVGIITLPGGKGHLAMAVLVNRSKLSPERQEKLIAEMARAAFDAYASR